MKLFDEKNSLTHNWNVQGSCIKLDWLSDEMKLHKWAEKWPPQNAEFFFLKYDFKNVLTYYLSLKSLERMESGCRIKVLI